LKVIFSCQVGKQPDLLQLAEPRPAQLSGNSQEVGNQGSEGSTNVQPGSLSKCLFCSFLQARIPLDPSCWARSPGGFNASSCCASWKYYSCL